MELSNLMGQNKENKEVKEDRKGRRKVRMKDKEER